MREDRQEPADILLRKMHPATDDLAGYVVNRGLVLPEPDRVLGRKRAFLKAAPSAVEIVKVDAPKLRGVRLKSTLRIGATSVFGIGGEGGV